MYDLILVFVMVGWAIQKIIDKKLLFKTDSNEFTKWTILFHFILILPLIFYVEYVTFYLALFIFLISVLSLISSFLGFDAMKKDEVSRITPFMQFSGLFAVVLAYLFLDETVIWENYIGIILMFIGGFIVAYEKPLADLKSFIKSNIAIALVIVAAFISGMTTLINKALLFGISAVSLLFYRRLSSAIVTIPIIKKTLNFNFKEWIMFIISRALSTYGLLAFFWVLSKQKLMYTVPILAVQPLIVLIFGRKFLSESKKVSRLIAVVIVVLGYILLKV